jgi:hypothetical protein
MKTNLANLLFAGSSNAVDGEAGLDFSWNPIDRKPLIASATVQNAHPLSFEARPK